MKTLILAAIRCSLMFLVTGSLFSVQPAQAYTVTLQQTGSNVVATGSGAINLTGLTFVISGADNPGIVPFSGVISTGPFASMIDGYRGFTGPMDFGSGAGALPNTASGDFVGISGVGLGLFVPLNYISGTALSDSMTFNNATFASLGVTPGTYVWTWGDGANQRFTLRIGTVPDGGSTISLLGCALLGLAALRRKLPLLRGRKS
jgi:VPDSG-CTERM motif